MDLPQLLMTSILAAIFFAMTWAGCAVIACLHPQLQKGFARAPFSALMACATTFVWNGGCSL